MIRDSGSKATRDLIARLAKSYSVTAGIHEEEGSAQKLEPVHNIGPVKPGERRERGKKTETAETVADVATKHVLGIGTPVRDFVGGWVDENESTARAALTKAMQPAVRGDGQVEKQLARFGLWAAGQMKQRMADGIEPELSDARKLEKQLLTGQSKDTPLILTGQLRSSIRSKVKTGEH